MPFPAVFRTTLLRNWNRRLFFKFFGPSLKPTIRYLFHKVFPLPPFLPCGIIVRDSLGPSPLRPPSFLPCTNFPAFQLAFIFPTPAFHIPIFAQSPIKCWSRSCVLPSPTLSIPYLLYQRTPESPTERVGGDVFRPFRLKPGVANRLVA